MFSEVIEGSIWPTFFINISLSKSSMLAIMIIEGFLVLLTRVPFSLGRHLTAEVEVTTKCIEWHR